MYMILQLLFAEFCATTAQSPVRRSNVRHNNLFIVRIVCLLLELSVVRSTGEGNYIADVTHARNEEEQTLEAQAEA